MIKRVLILLLLVGMARSTVAQLYPYKWRIGVSAGYATYYGDVSPYRIDEFADLGKVFRWFDYNPNYIPQPSFSLSLETKLTPTIGVSLKGGYYSFAMSDRYVDRSGDLQTDSRNFNRALNFKTDLTDVGLALVFRSDNGKILNRKALVAPYLALGAGALWFNVYGDLYDATGQRYDYATNSIVVDGNYETNLQPLRTETSEGYDNWAFYGELSLGIRFRLAHRWEAFIQSDLKYTTTDYLDDVSGRYRSSYVSEEQQYAANPTNLPEAGNYRGNPNGVNDAFFYHSVGVKFSFAHSKEDFTAPVIYGEGWSDPAPSDLTAVQTREQPAKTSDSSADKPDEDYDEVTMNESLREDLKPTMEWLENELAIVQMREREDALVRQQDSLQQVRDQLLAQNSALKAQLDTLPEDSAMLKALSDQEMRADSLSAALDSLRNERLVVEEERQSLDSALSAQKEVREAEPQATQTTVVRDTVVHTPQTQPTDTVYMKPAMAEERSTDQKIYELMERQAARDSVILMRLTDLLATSRSAETSTPPPQRSYESTGETTETYQTTESGSDVSAGDLESLRMEVEFLREQLNRESRYTSDGAFAGGASPSVVVVPSGGGGGRDTVYQYDEKRAAENQQLRAELQQMRTEMDALRRDMRVRDNMIEKLLSEEKVSTGEIEQLADSASTDSIIAPPSPIAIDSVAIDTNQIKLDTTAVQSGVRLDSISTDSVPDREPAPSIPSDTTDVEPAIESIPEQGPALPESREVNVYFALNSTSVKPEDEGKLKKVAELWHAYPTSIIRLTSYADNTGNAAYNRKLCEQRNQAVKTVLTDQFDVSAEKISTEVGGKIVRNGKAWNPDDRRVEVVIEAAE